MASRHQILEYSSMTSMAFQLVRYTLYGNHMIGHTGSIYTYPPGVYCSKTCCYDIDISIVYPSRGRWTRLVNVYVDPEQLSRFETRIKRLPEMEKRSKTVSLHFNDVVNAKGKDHPWGGCLLSLTYRNNPPHLTLHSRTSRIGYTSFIDLAMAHVILRDVVCPVVQLRPSDVAFTWFVDLPQLSAIYILRYMVKNPRWRQELKKAHTVLPWKDIVRNYKRISKGDNTWGPTKRIYQDMQRKKIKPIPVSSLELF